MAQIKLKDATIDQIGRDIYNNPTKWGLHEVSEDMTIYKGGGSLTITLRTIGTLPVPFTENPVEKYTEVTYTGIDETYTIEI